ncbi:hypothetical protein BKA62DRAFT_328908 [Auriculariales sp. MPI-PUGE-AT-0066]|nr:hypothetical protein BKA62DRAFT_328908 [Auriculariales sp. MPI-PUGE-AT-0066]
MQWPDLRHFFGSLRVPPASYPSVISGLLLICAANFTWTLSSAVSRRGRLMRLAIAPAAFFCFFEFGYKSWGVELNRLTTVGINVVSLYGMMQTFSLCIVGLVDQSSPHWVDLRTGESITIPDSLLWRIIFALDLTTSLRGTSWLAGRNFNWCTSGVRKLQQQMPTRRIFLRNAFFTLIAQYLIVDFFDTLNKRRHWPTHTMHPVTSLPWAEQLMSAFSVCMGTINAIIIEHTLMAAIFIALGSPIEGWPPMFYSPFSAMSLQDLWTRRWHSIFRRSFDRLSIPLLALLPAKWNAPARPFVAFWLSAMLHLLIMDRLETTEQFVHPSFADSSILKFFVAQPFALIIEHICIKPLASKFLPERWQIVPMRLWAWASMLYTGRYWADVWVRRGLWGPEEKVVPFSVVRGLWKGEWYV